MINYVLKKETRRTSAYAGKWYAKPKMDYMVELDELARHMANHNTPFSAGAIKGILTDMVSCIKELLLDGKNVKLPDLAIFSIGIVNKTGGADSEEAFQQAVNIEGLRLRCRATGTLRQDKIQGSLQRAKVVKKSADKSQSGD